jgi:uncharacterized protein (DUF2126 family)
MQGDHRRVYDEARQTRLGADKFMIDGKHTGTGGGNHVVVGGATPLDSPFLSRPDLLRKPYPALAAAPEPVLPVLGPFHRPDQPGAAHRRGAHDGLYELEIALSRSPLPARESPFTWLRRPSAAQHADDVTGNTHRAEICIDKLYSPDGPTGRLGLSSSAASKCRRSRA